MLGAEALRLCPADYDVYTQWQPVDSQRITLWSAQFGRGEEYAEALAQRHFERAETRAQQIGGSGGSLEPPEHLS